MTKMLWRPLLSVVVCVPLMVTALGQDSESRRFEANEDGVQLTAELNADGAIRIAEPVPLRITVVAPSGTSVVMPRVGVTLGDWLVVDARDTSDVPLSGSDSRRQSSLLVTLESLSTGERRTPSMEVLYRLSSDRKGGANPEASSVAGEPRQGVITIPPLSMNVDSVLDANEAPDKFRDIKDGMAAIPNSEAAGSHRLAWIGGLLGMLVLGIAIGKWLRRQPKPGPWARQQISEIEAQHAQGILSTAEAYMQVSLGLRRYLQLSHDTPARALATDEITMSLGQSGFSNDAIESACRVLETADACKFSPQGAPFTSESSLFDDARLVINESEAIHSASGRQPLGASSIAGTRETVEVGA